MSHFWGTGITPHAIRSKYQITVMAVSIDIRFRLSSAFIDEVHVMYVSRSPFENFTGNAKEEQRIKTENNTVVDFMFVCVL